MGRLETLNLRSDPLQSPDPGISLATLFSGRTPATPAAGVPKRTDGPKFEDSLAQASDRTDPVQRSDDAHRVRDEPTARVDQREEPTKPFKSSDAARNEVRNVQQGPDDPVSSYARARLLIAEPAAEPQEPTGVVSAVVPQSTVNGDKNPPPVDIESSNSELPETDPNSEDLIFHIQPWPLNSTTDDAYSVQPAVVEKPASVEDLEPQSADTNSTSVGESGLVEQTVVFPPTASATTPQSTQPQDSEITGPVDAPESSSAVRPLANRTDVAVPKTVHEPTVAAAEPKNVKLQPASDPVQPAPQIERAEQPAAAQTEPTHSDQVPASQPLRLSPQPTEPGVPTQHPASTAQAPGAGPAIEVPINSEATPEAEPTLAGPENFEKAEPAERAAVKTDGESSFANTLEVDVQAGPAPPHVQPQSNQPVTANAVRQVTGTLRRVADVTVAAAGVTVAAGEDAGESTSSGSGSQNFDGQSFSSLLQAQITQGSPSQRASQQIEVNPTQFIEMPAEVVSRARTLADNEATELEILLDPPELGQLKIQLRRTDGEVAARITVTDPAAFELLQNELHGLRENLQQSGVPFGSVDVEQEQQQQHAFDREQHDRHPREDAEPASRETRASPLTPAHQTIDIRV